MGLTRLRRTAWLLTLEALGALALTATACSSTHAASTPPAYVLEGMYRVTLPDAGSTDAGFAEGARGDILRVDGATYSIRYDPCPAGTGLEDAGPAGLDLEDGCTSFGSFAIADDGSTLSLTDSSTGNTTTLPFKVLESTPVSVDAAVSDAGTSLGGNASALHPLGGTQLVNGTTPIVSSVQQVLVFLFGATPYAAVPCSGQSSQAGAETGGMIRTVTDSNYTCIQSSITFPTYNVPPATDGGAYCTSLATKGCGPSNYYGRVGTPYVYSTFYEPPSQCECGFEYSPGRSGAQGQQGDARFLPYIKCSGAGFDYGLDSSSIRGLPAKATVWCGLEPNGKVQMKIDGTFVLSQTNKGSFMTSTQKFAGQATHVFRITGLAWENTSPLFGPYTCKDAMHQFGPVVYDDTLVCPGASRTPSVHYNTSANSISGEVSARWPNGKFGYCLSPASEVTETQSGTTDTDLLFPGGG